MPGYRHARPLLLCLVLLITACGFRLAGTASLPPELDSIQLIASDLSAAQRERLIARLERAGARVTGVAGEASIQLVVSLESVPDRRLATSASTGRNVNRLSRRLVFSLRDDGAPLAPPRSLVQQKDIAVDDDNLLASDEERDSVLRELEQALFEQLIRQLARI